VLVSPCISPGEKEVSRAALTEGLPLVVLLENGFAPGWKPPGAWFKACAEGRLLLLAPWPHHAEKRPITRAQCLALNALAERICGGGAAPANPPGKYAGPQHANEPDSKQGVASPGKQPMADRAVAGHTCPAEAEPGKYAGPQHELSEAGTRGEAPPGKQPMADRAVAGHICPAEAEPGKYAGPQHANEPDSKQGVASPGKQPMADRAVAGHICPARRFQ
jgi:hypothetical protein